MESSPYALWISVIALIVSLLNAWYTYKQKENHNRINIRSTYFEKAFDQHLLVNLPEARKYLRFSSKGRLADVEKLSGALSDLRQSALYFMYANNSFYEELRVNIEKLDDYIQDCGNKRFDANQQINVLKDVQEMMQSIYDCIDKARVGEV